MATDDHNLDDPRLEPGGGPAAPSGATVMTTDAVEEAPEPSPPAGRTSWFGASAHLVRRAVIYLLFGLVVAALAEVMLEAARTGWNWAWLKSFLATDPGVAVVGMVPLLVVVIALLALTGRMWLTASLVLAVVNLLGIASQIKSEDRREPLYPRDMIFVLQPKFLLTMVQPRQLLLSLLGLLPILAFSWGLSRLFKVWLRRRDARTRVSRWRTVSWVSRVSVLAACLLLLSSIPHFNHRGNPWREAFEAGGANWVKWNQAVNYTRNGFVGAFLYNLDVPAMAKPPGYSKAAIEQIVAKYTKQADQINQTRSATALDDVNVVSILSESFTDPTRLKGMQLAKDPIPFTRKLMQGLPHGNMLAFKTGGGTSSMEFEVLTGMSMSQYNSAMDTPYQMLVPKYKSFPSAVELFNQMGHKTLAIHPYRASMYQRDKTYPILGFSDFIDRTKMKFRAREEKNRFIDDHAAFRQVLDAINTESKPLFVNLVTMQNHAPYGGKYEHPIKVTGLSEGTVMVRQYSQGLNYSDKAMAQFVRALSRSKEKTIFVFYGDHVPAGYPNELFQANSDRTMHETPFFIYANFGKPKPEEFPTTSPIFFLPNVFDVAGAPLPPYYVMLQDLEHHVAAMEHGDIITSDNAKVTAKALSPAARAVLRDYRMVQYDLSVGDRYSEKMFYPTPAGAVSASGSGE